MGWIQQITADFLSVVVRLIYPLRVRFSTLESQQLIINYFH